MMNTLLTPQEVLQAIIDGKRVVWTDKDDPDQEWFYLNKDSEIADLLNDNYIFALNQEMITIGDVSFPKPESEPLREGERYFYLNITKTHLVDYFEWVDDELDFKLLKANMVHLTKENAIAHAKALIRLSGASVDE